MCAKFDCNHIWSTIFCLIRHETESHLMPNALENWICVRLKSKERMSGPFFSWLLLLKWSYFTSLSSSFLDLWTFKACHRKRGEFFHSRREKPSSRIWTFRSLVIIIYRHEDLFITHSTHNILCWFIFTSVYLCRRPHVSCPGDCNRPMPTSPADDIEPRSAKN